MPQPIRMQGIKIPLGTAVPAVSVVKINQTVLNINAFQNNISL